MKNWVMPSIVTAEIGLRPTQLRGMVQRKKLTRGVHYAVIDGKMMFSLDAVKQWFAEQAYQSMNNGYRPTRTKIKTPRMVLRSNP